MMLGVVNVAAAFNPGINPRRNFDSMKSRLDYLLNRLQLIGWSVNNPRSARGLLLGMNPILYPFATPLELMKIK